MGFLGYLIYLGALFVAVYLGYLGDFNVAVLLLVPLGLLVGQLMQRGARSAALFDRRGAGVLVELISRYVMGLILAAIFFGIGIGIFEILKHRPN